MLFIPNGLLTLKRKPSLLEVDSAVLDGVLKEILKNKTLRKGEEIDFVKDARQALNLVEKGTYQMTLLLKPLSLKKLKERDCRCLNKSLVISK